MHSSPTFSYVLLIWQPCVSVPGSVSSQVEWQQSSSPLLPAPLLLCSLLLQPWGQGSWAQIILGVDKQADVGKKQQRV